jgi:hypothetical protein
MRKQTFEDFLKDKHYENNPKLLDDDLPEKFDTWIGDLQADDFIDYGQEYADSQVNLGLNAEEEALAIQTIEHEKGRDLTE